jgi:probable HAF family extracellular repeat protein
MIDLGTLGGSFSTAEGINDRGVVVGASAVATDNRSHAFVWTLETGMVDLGTLGGLDSWAHAISDDGVVVGNSQTTSGENHAFAWSRQTGMVDIGATGHDSWAERISNHTIIGQGYTATGTRHGFVWMRRESPEDLGTLGGDSSHANAVNDRGTVVGGSWTELNLEWRAFAWTRGTGMIALDAPGGGQSEAIDVNGNRIVGYSCSVGNSTCHATLWRPRVHKN